MTDTAVATINQHLEITTSISNATRLGNKTTKVKLLKITASSERDKAITLKKCTKLRSEYLL